MFGKNEIVGQKYFKDAEDKLYVTSIFYTLQGEGPFRGLPAVFVRLAKCNLNCSFCDTYFDSGDWLTIPEIEKRIDGVINKHFDDHVPNWARYEVELEGIDEVPYYWRKRQMVLVVTGGEPMLQKNIVPFLNRMNDLFESTQIESNGIIWQDIPGYTTLVVSPKVSEKSGKYLEPHPKVMERADYFKYVVSADPTSPYHDIPDWSEPDVVFISPMNIYNREPQKAKTAHMKNSTSIEERSTVDEIISFWEPGLLNMEENQKNHEYAARLCLDNGYILNLQIHLYASLA